MSLGAWNGLGKWGFSAAPQVTVDFLPVSSISALQAFIFQDLKTIDFIPAFSTSEISSFNFTTGSTSLGEFPLSALSFVFSPVE